MKLKSPIRFLILTILVVGLACSTVTGGGEGESNPQAPAAPIEIFEQSAPPTAVSTPFEGLTGTGSVSRTSLTADDLLTGTSTAPVNDAAFALPADAAPPTFTFQGHLELAGEAKDGGFTLLRDDFGYNSDPQWQHLPEMSFDFVQSGSHLIPVEQGLAYSGHPHWNYMVAPGRAWQEAGDQGYSRASFPFALIERNQNCVHNGVATFLFNDTAVSNVRYQVTQETCMYFKFDMWGQLKATYSPGAVESAETVITSHFDWLENQLLTKPISAINEDFPKVSFNEAMLTAGVSPGDLTTYGIVINGVNYVSDCKTRYGEYPYCTEMRLPSYSTAKSALAGVAYMRLGQLYDPNLGSIPLKDYLAQASGDNWDSVTLNNALDMTTGHYGTPMYMVDEYSGRLTSKFIVAEPHGEKLAFALKFPYGTPPGQLWVYHSTDTYLATQFMYEYLRSQAGGDADLFDMLVNDIFAPLNFSQGSLSSLRTDNSPSGRAFGSHGMFYTQDDIAKLASFLTVGGGAINGQQILHPDLLADTMQRDPSDRGVSTLAYDFQYNNSFWAKDFSRVDSPSYDCNFTVVFMSGYGGITVAMMPNGATYYYFSDNGEFSWYPAVEQVNQLSPMCGD